MMDSGFGGGGGVAESESRSRTLLKRSVYFAIIKCDLKEANGLLEPVRPADREWLRGLRVRGQPLLHYLAGKRAFRSTGSEETEQEELDRFVKFCVQAGLDTEQLGNIHNNIVQDLLGNNSEELVGCTGLVGALHVGNRPLAESLIRCGANVNFRDEQGRSATHTCILKNDLKMLKLLVEHGAELKSTPEELAGFNGIHPPLHTAIDARSKEIVDYLISKNLVDVNETAVYSLTADSGLVSLFLEIPSGSEEPGRGSVSVACSPIGRAVLSNECQLVLVRLLLDSNAVLQGFRELDFCVRVGLPKLVSMLLSRFSDETIRDHRIDDVDLAVVCFPSRPIADEASRKEFFRLLISAYTRARTGFGRDLVNIRAQAEFAVRMERITWRLALSSQKLYKVSNYSILHMAAASGDAALLKAVVRKGAELNCLTGTRGGDLRCSPLHLAIMTGKAAMTEYLVEQGSDLELEGDVIDPNSRFGFTHVVRERMRDYGDPVRFGRFNALELLLQWGLPRGAPILEKMLSSRRFGGFHGADELLLAVSGGNVDFVNRIFSIVQWRLGAGEFQWIRLWEGEAQEVRVPLFQHMANNLKIELGTVHLVGCWLTDLLKALISRGYDCNAVRAGGGESQIFSVLYVAVYFGVGPVGATLLNTFLSYPNLQINVRNQGGETPVGFLLREWNGRCSEDLPCVTRGDLQPDLLRVLKLLLEHGADVSGLEIGAETKYHRGLGDGIKCLYSAGARVKAEFFEDPLCGQGSRETLVREVEDLREWISSDGEKMRLDLKVLCRAAIRRSVRRVGDLQKLDRLAPKLRNYVDMKEEPKEKSLGNM